MAAQAERQVVLSGDMSELDIASIMSTFSLSRQVMQLEILDAQGNCEGTIVTKAGRVISATAGDLSGAAAVHRLLETDRSACFRVVCAVGGEAQHALSLVKPADEPLDSKSRERRQSGEQARDPAGNGASTSPKAVAGERRGAAVAVEGTLDSISLPEVLRAIALSRNYIVVEVCDDNGVLSGVVHVKAGQVLWAQTGSLLERDALRELSKMPSTYRFGVFHESRSVSGVQPLGTVHDLVQMLVDELSTTQPGHGGPPGLEHGPSTGVVAKLSADSTAASVPRKAKVDPGFGGRTQLGLGGNERKHILDGSLTELDLREVVLALSTGRQFYEVQVFAPLGQILGSLELKTDMLISARFGDEFGIEAARKLLPLSGDYRFAVFTVIPAPKELNPLARLSALTQSEPQSEPQKELFDEDQQNTVSEVAALAQSSPAKSSSITDVQDIVVLDGNLADFDLGSLVQVAGTSRQHTSVRVFDDQRQRVGAVHVKSGVVLKADAWGMTGAAAMNRLIYSPRDFSFVVVRHYGVDLPHDPLGRVEDVVREAMMSGRSTLQEPREPANASGAATALTAATPAMSTTERDPQGSSGLPKGWLGGALFGAGFALVGAFVAGLIFYRQPIATVVSPSTQAPPPPPSTPSASPAPRGSSAGSEEVTADDNVEVADSAPMQGTARKPNQVDSIFGGAGQAGLTAPAVASIQAALKHLGHDPGPIDGVIGPRTSAAIEAFQRAEHLVESGVLTESTRAKLSERISGP